VLTREDASVTDISRLDVKALVRDIQAVSSSSVTITMTPTGVALTIDPTPITSPPPPPPPDPKKSTTTQNADRLTKDAGAATVSPNEAAKDNKTDIVTVIAQGFQQAGEFIADVVNEPPPLVNPPGPTPAPGPVPVPRVYPPMGGGDLSMMVLRLGQGLPSELKVVVGGLIVVGLIAAVIFVPGAFANPFGVVFLISVDVGALALATQGGCELSQRR
jgi:hypothetical protein